MLIFGAVVLVLMAFFVPLAISKKSLPKPEPESPTRHLDERKAAIYENLRDLQLEYRMGKLSDQDYQQTKSDLQKDLALVLLQIDRVATATVNEKG
tara:strand:- start:18373 stop:18660 length:288 start_codon:yes stop_codon:yes gene_type:complete